MAITRITAPSITGLVIPNTSINNASLDSVTALPSGVPVGKIGQVVQVTKTDSSTISLSTGSLYTFMTANITPSATTSKILISYVVHMGQQSNQAFPYCTIRRDGSDIFRADAVGSRQRATSTSGGNSANNSTQYNLTQTQQFLDSPNSISSLAYTLNAGGYSSRTFYINIPDSNGDFIASATSTLTLMEVLA